MNNSFAELLCFFTLLIELLGIVVKVDLISRIRVAMDGKQQEGKVHALRPRITLVLVSGGATSTERVDAMVDATVWIGKPGTV